MQNTPTIPLQPHTQYNPHPQNTPPSSPMPPQSHAKKRFKNVKRLAGVSSAVATLAAVVAILQFLGVTNLSFIYQLVPSPAPLPVIGESVYKEINPACKAMHSPDIHWFASNVKYTCLPNDAGTRLNQTDELMIPALSFEAIDKYRFASDHIVGATIANIANNVCAGLATRENSQNHAAYGFFICGNGDWYIAKFSKDTGTPTVLAQSTSTTKELASDHYNIKVIVLGSGLQMVINNHVEGVYTARDSDFALTTKMSILFGEEGALTSYASANFLTSITVSNFYYETGRLAPNTLPSLHLMKWECMCNVLLPIQESPGLLRLRNAPLR